MLSLERTWKYLVLWVFSGISDKDYIIGEQSDLSLYIIQSLKHANFSVCDFIDLIREV